MVNLKMPKTQYEGYSQGKYSIAVREKFGNINVYAKNAQSLLNKATGFIDYYDFTLNPYRGCQYGCSYCYAAAFSPNSQMRKNWGNWVIIKQNAAEILERELINWYDKNPQRPPIIYMSTVTDPYQPIESKEKLTRCLLEILVKYQPILVIQTRSPMITRDIDILQKFQKLRINMSIPTGSEQVRKDFEPRAPSIPARLRAIGTLRHSIPYQNNHDIRFSVTITPLLPTFPQDQLKFIKKLEKSGQDPQYKFALSPYVYLMRYFLDNVYCAYLAWFFIYKSGLLPTKINILDIAAGSGTIAYGLALLLQSITKFSTLDTQHISYYSLEQHKDFQYRGLQFWRSYIERQEIATNAYFRFDTSSIFDYNCQSKKIPLKFFDFIVISHCFFSNPETRIKSQTIYQQIFSNLLTKNGYVLLIIQDKKLFKAYNVRPSEDPHQEELTIKNFVEDLGLKLVWYKYLTSRYSRKPIANFGKFARENLACQKFMSPLLRQYFKLNFDSNYTLDDYVILAQSVN